MHGYLSGRYGVGLVSNDRLDVILVGSGYDRGILREDSGQDKKEEDNL